MKKVLYLIFSLISNIGCFVTFILTIVFSALAAFGKMTFVLPIVFASICLVLGIVALVVNKIGDKNYAGKKMLITKYKFMKIGNGLIFNKLAFFFYFVFIFALFIFGFVALAEKESVSFDKVGCFVSGGCMIFAFASCQNLFGGYVDRHCSHCGSSLSGGDYDYEEEERKFRINNDGKVNRTSKIRFEFTCPVCEESTVYRRKMSTNAEKVERFAEHIVK